MGIYWEKIADDIDPYSMILNTASFKISKDPSFVGQLDYFYASMLLDLAFAMTRKLKRVDSHGL